MNYDLLVISKGQTNDLCNEIKKKLEKLSSRLRKITHREHFFK